MFKNEPDYFAAPTDHDKDKMLVVKKMSQSQDSFEIIILTLVIYSWLNKSGIGHLDVNIQRKKPFSLKEIQNGKNE